MFTDDIIRLQYHPASPRAIEVPLQQQKEPDSTSCDELGSLVARHSKTTNGRRTFKPVYSTASSRQLQQYLTKVSLVHVFLLMGYVNPCENNYTIVNQNHDTQSLPQRHAKLSCIAFLHRLPFLVPHPFHSWSSEMNQPTHAETPFINGSSYCKSLAASILRSSMDEYIPRICEDHDRKTSTKQHNLFPAPKSYSIFPQAHRNVAVLTEEPIESKTLFGAEGFDFSLIKPDDSQASPAKTSEPQAAFNYVFKGRDALDYNALGKRKLDNNILDLLSTPVQESSRQKYEGLGHITIKHGLNNDKNLPSLNSWHDSHNNATGELTNSFVGVKCQTSSRIACDESNSPEASLFFLIDSLLANEDCISRGKTKENGSSFFSPTDSAAECHHDDGEAFFKSYQAIDLPSTSVPLLRINDVTATEDDAELEFPDMLSVSTSVSEQDDDLEIDVSGNESLGAWHDKTEDTSDDIHEIELIEASNRLQRFMTLSNETMSSLQQWDRANGLPKSHSQTMVNSSRSRDQLLSGEVLQKWNGTPLLRLKGAKIRIRRRMFAGRKVDGI